MLFSEPKIPQTDTGKRILPTWAGFSALQRAENSSTPSCRCSFKRSTSFSALQRAENSSTRHWVTYNVTNMTVSVLFSEPKIPQLLMSVSLLTTMLAVSVLFSEPKIPQRLMGRRRMERRRMFQCSSASRKFLNCTVVLPRTRRARGFQCSSASRKFLNYGYRRSPDSRPRVSVLFSEPKIPQPQVLA